MRTKLGMRQTLYLVLGLVVLVVMVAAPTKPASAATYTVTKTEDTADGACDADCSLREAIIATNGIPGADTITLPAGTYTLSILGTGEEAAGKGDLDVTDDLTINGAGAGSTVIDGGALDRVFHVDPATSGVAMEISGLTVQNGNTVDFGGGIYNLGGPLTLINVTVSGNTATNGGGIYNFGGPLTLINVTVGVNHTPGFGGGILNRGSATLTSVTVSGNTGTYGGGIYNYIAPLTLTNVTVSGNTGTSSSGGIYNFDGTLALVNVTVSGNMAAADGGGIYNDAVGAGGTVTLTNTIVANSGSAGDCSGTITSQGHNLASDGSCGLTGTGDLPNADPVLGPLANNGGPTKTHALLPGSPAIDAGAACPATDQRGVTRPQGGACDIGAYELTKQGDVDCNGTVDSVDALKLLRHVAGLSVSQQPGCTPIGTGDPLQGDVDCNDAVNSVDALKVLRYVAGLSVAQTEPCPDIGSTTG